MRLPGKPPRALTLRFIELGVQIGDSSTQDRVFLLKAADGCLETGLICCTAAAAAACKRGACAENGSGHCALPGHFLLFFLLAGQLLFALASLPLKSLKLTLDVLAPIILELGDEGCNVKA
jgi:hypothetical protein